MDQEIQRAKQDIERIVRSEVVGTRNQISQLSDKLLKYVDDKIKEALDQVSSDQGSGGSAPPKSSDLNYYTEGTYDGRTVKFSLFGEVVDPQDEPFLSADEFIQLAGGGDSEFAFKLYPTTTGGQNPQPRIGVVYGEVNEQPPSGMTTSSPFLISPANNATVYLNITFDTDGSVQSTAITSGASVPNNTETNLYVRLGIVALANNAYSITRQIHFSGNIIVRRQNVCFDGNPKIDYLFVATKDLVEVQ